jgi:hypothetical protein
LRSPEPPQRLVGIEANSISQEKQLDHVNTQFAATALNAAYP